MANLTQRHRDLAISIDGFQGDQFLIEEMEGTEALSELFEYKVNIVGYEFYQSSDLLGRSITVKLALNDGGERFFNGIISSFIFLGADPRSANEDLLGYQLIISPKLALTRHSIRNRVFRAKKPTEIISDILTEWGIDFEDKFLAKTYYEYDQHLQYKESDFEYLTRIMSREGIFFRFAHSANSHILELRDENPAESKLEPIAYHPNKKEGDGLYQWTMEETLNEQNLFLDDYNFERMRDDYSCGPTSSSQKSTLNKQVSDLMTLSRLGEYRHLKNRGNMANYGQGLLDVNQRRAKTWRINWGGASRNRGIAPFGAYKLNAFHGGNGLKFLVDKVSLRIKPAPFESISHESPWETVFDCQFEARDYSVDYAPKSSKESNSEASSPILVYGVVCDSDGQIDPEEALKVIDVDDVMRVKVKLSWVEKSSSLNNQVIQARVSQVWAHQETGQFMIPRVGTEVLVALDPSHNGNFDALILGSAFNNINRPPTAYDFFPVDAKSSTHEYQQFATVLRSEAVKTNGSPISSSKRAEIVEKYPDPIPVDVNELSKGDNQRQYSEIGMYNRNSNNFPNPSGEGAANSSAGALAEDAVNANDGDIGFKPFDDTDTLSAFYTGLKDSNTTDNTPFEGVNIYSNNRVLCQSPRDQVFQSGGNIVLEAAKSITLKVGGSSIVISDGLIDVRNLAGGDRTPIWNSAGKTDWATSANDGCLQAMPFLSRMTGWRTKSYAAWDASMGSYFGARMHCSQHEALIKAGYIQTLASGDYAQEYVSDAEEKGSTPVSSAAISAAKTVAASSQSAELTALQAYTAYAGKYASITWKPEELYLEAASYFTVSNAFHRIQKATAGTGVPDLDNETVGNHEQDEPEQKFEWFLAVNEARLEFFENCGFKFSNGLLEVDILKVCELGLFKLMKAELKIEDSELQIAYQKMTMEKEETVAVSEIIEGARDAIIALNDLNVLSMTNMAALGMYM